MMKGLFDSKHYQERALARMQIRQKEEWLLSSLKHAETGDDAIRVQARVTCLWLCKAYFSMSPKQMINLDDFNKALRLLTPILQALLLNNHRPKQSYLVDILLSRRVRRRSKFTRKYQYLQAMLYQQLAIQLDNPREEETALKLADTDVSLSELQNWFNQERPTQWIQDKLLKISLGELFLLYQQLQQVLLKEESIVSGHCVFELLKEAFERQGFAILYSFDEFLAKSVRNVEDYSFTPSNQEVIETIFEKLKD